MAYKLAQRRESNMHARRELFRRYGLTSSDYQAMLVRQNGVCAMCHRDCRTGQRLCVDHNHVTGEVRALLCRRCNAGLGYLEDAAWMAVATSFLASASAEQVPA